MLRRPWVTAAALAAGVAGAHLAVGLAVGGPAARTDQAGELLAARFLAGDAPAPHLPASPAYAFLLSPLAALTSGPEALWRAAVVLDAALAGVTVFLAWALARRWAAGAGAPARGAALLAAVVAAVAYPALWVWSGLTVAEHLAVPAFLLTVLLVLRAATTMAPARWAAAGAAAGLTAAVHPRAVVVPLCLLALAAAAARPGPDRARWAGAVALGAGPVLLAGWAATAVLGRQVAPGRRAPNLLAAIGDRWAAGTLDQVPVQVAGQVWYLTVATFGLFPLGLAVALAALGRAARADPAARAARIGPPVAGRNWDAKWSLQRPFRVPVRRGWSLLGPEADAGARGQEATGAFVALSTMAVVVSGAVYLAGDARLDAVVHGRAGETVLVPVILLGALSLVRRGRAGGGLRDLLRPAAVIAGTLVASGAVVVLGRGANDIRLPLDRPALAGLDALLAWRGLTVSVALFTAVAGLGAALLLGAGRRPATAAAVAALLFVPSAATGQTALVDATHRQAGQAVVAGAIEAVGRRLGAGGCVGFDTATGAEDQRTNYELRLDDVRLRPFSSGRPRRGSESRPCGALAVSDRSGFERAYPGSRRVTLENDGNLALWALPGRAQDRLAEAGWLLPPQLPRPVPPGDRRYRITAAEARPRAVAMRLDGLETVRITLTHAGTSEPWPNAQGLGTRDRSVRVGARWYRVGAPWRVDGHPSLDRTRVDLPRTLLPGESVTVDVPLDPAPNGRPSPLRAGTYVVRIGVVQRDVDWFEPVGAPFEVEVVALGRVF